MTDQEPYTVHMGAARSAGERTDTALDSARVPAQLTPRELECLALAAKGHSAKAVGAGLGIAPRTVERHLDQARMKLQARNRVHLVMRAIHLGILAN